MRCRLSSSRRMRCLLLACLRQSGSPRLVIETHASTALRLTSFDRGIGFFEKLYHGLPEVAKCVTTPVNSRGLADTTVPSTLSDSVGLIEKVGYLG